MSDVREQEIRERAYELYLRRGCEEGFALLDRSKPEQKVLDEEIFEPVAETNTRTMKA